MMGKKDGMMSRDSRDAAMKSRAVPAAAVIIPALNEAIVIGDVVRGVRALPDIACVIVADNGSSDETASKAAGAGAVVVSEGRRGYGYACAAGMAAALELGADILVFMDGDGSSLPDELPRLLAPLLEERAELVLGSRRLGHIAAGAMPGHQRWGNWLSSWMMRLMYQAQVTDLGPYRAIRADLLESLVMREMTFGWPTEMMVKAAKVGARIVEVPVTWQSRQGGRSKVGGSVRGSMLAAYHILLVILRYLFWKRT